MEKLTLTGVFRNDRTSKDGKPYVSISIKTSQYGDRYLSGFGAPWNAQWKAGDEVEVDITKKAGKDKNGKDVEYLNFTKPNPMVDFAKTIMSLTVRVGKIEEQLKALSRPTPAQMQSPPEEELETINADLAGMENPDLPF